MSTDWQNGYSAGYDNGFEAGYNKAKNEKQTNPYFIPTPTPDGMSYEEIYGSVVYQQERKNKS